MNGTYVIYHTRGFPLSVGPWDGGGVSVVQRIFVAFECFFVVVPRLTVKFPVMAHAHGTFKSDGNLLCYTEGCNYYLAISVPSVQPQWSCSNH